MSDCLTVNVPVMGGGSDQQETLEDSVSRKMMMMMTLRNVRSAGGIKSESRHGRVSHRGGTHQYRANMLTSVSTTVWLQ